jgi:NADPH2:quinone reductase
VRYRRIIIHQPGGPEVLQSVDVPLPEPGPRQVRVRVLAAGVARADFLMRMGQYPGSVPAYPYTPGCDVAGVVEAVGSQVTFCQPGTRVAALTGLGGYAECICLPEQDVIAFPEALDPAEVVCLVLNYLTAYQMLHRFADLRPGDCVLVHAAASGVGTALLQLGALQELQLIGTASPGKHALVSSLRCTPIDYRREDFVRRVQALKPGGVAAAFDPVGGSHLWRSFRTLRPDGLLIAYGEMAVTGRQPPRPSELFWHHRLPRWLNWIPGRRSARWYEVFDEWQAHPDWYRADLRALIDLLAQGRIKPVIAARLTLAEAARAHQLLEASAVSGKIVLMCAA